MQINLKELVLKSGYAVSNNNLVMIKLTRNGQEFRYTAGQLFDLTAPEIIIQNNDQIAIQIISNEPKKIISTVGSKGNILLGDIGSISAVNRTIDNLYEECEKLYYENEINKQKDKDIYTFYMMFNVVIYMLIIGSNIKQCLLKDKQRCVDQVEESLTPIND